MARRKRDEAGPLAAKVNFYSENILFRLKDKKILAAFIKEFIQLEGSVCGEISFIFCDDDYLLDLNKRFLRHKTYTDIISFDYGENNIICGDIFISVPRVKANAEKFAVSFLNELHRVIFHGVLHFLGYKDKRPSDKKRMRAKEVQYLLLFDKMHLNSRPGAKIAVGPR